MNIIYIHSFKDGRSNSKLIYLECRRNTRPRKLDSVIETIGIKKKTLMNSISARHIKGSNRSHRLRNFFT